MHPVAAILWIGTSVITGAIVFGLAHVMLLPPGIDFMLFVFAAVAVFGATKPYFWTLRAEKTATSPRPGIDTFRKDVTSWRTSALGFSLLHYGLGTVGIASSSLAAAHPTLIVRDATVGQVISWIAAFTTALITFFGAQAKATRMTEATMRLQVAVSRFDIDQTYTFNHVADAHAECMKLLRAGK